LKANTIVEAESLARYYPVRRRFFARSRTLRALDGVSFSLAAGETLAVVGESGCGKSTLARQITLIEAPTAGVLKINGRDVTRASREEARFVRRNVQMVFQDPFGSLNPRKKIGSILEEPLVIKPAGRAPSGAKWRAT
jgi:dipeptide transport system ATP-binding protein